MNEPEGRRLEFEVACVKGLFDRAWQAAYSAGAEQMRERAAQVAEEEGKVERIDGGSITRWDACDNVAREIRNLPVGESSRATEGSKP